jgi:hypothetical protein
MPVAEPPVVESNGAATDSILVAPDCGKDGGNDGGNSDCNAFSSPLTIPIVLSSLIRTLCDPRRSSTVALTSVRQEEDVRTWYGLN